MSDFIFDANVRTEHGTGASRRLRHQGKLPAIVYGGDKAPVSLTLDHNKLNIAQEREAFYSSILTLNIDGSSEEVLVKAIQRHPYKPKILHMDFQRVSKNSEVVTTIPLHFINEEESAGARAGGTIVHLVNDVEIKCLPADLPEYIEVDVAALEAGQTLHLSDLTVPAKVTLTELSKAEGNDLSVVSIQPAKGGSDDDGEATDAEETGATE